MQRSLNRPRQRPPESPGRGDEDHVRFVIEPEIPEPLPGSFSPRAHGFTCTHFDTHEQKKSFFDKFNAQYRYR